MIYFDNAATTPLCDAAKQTIIEHLDTYGNPSSSYELGRQSRLLIEDARDEAMMASQKGYKSVLKPLISALAVKTGQLGSDSIWNTKINMFFDSIKRINKIQDAELLLQGAYSGFASLKGVDKDRLDWAGEI